MQTKATAKKLRTSLIAGTLAAAIALTGTFAWTNMRQMAINEAYTNKNPGARLHDDFDGLNKDVYAENFTDTQDGLPVFVRVRLSEYMETGTHAGRYRDGKDDMGVDLPTLPSGKKRDVTIVTKSRADNTADADINNPDTWPIHVPGAKATEVDISKGDGQEQVHQTWAWDLGGSTIYMPTFNKNKDSLSADINGTYVGPNGKFDAVDAYDDYVTYGEGETKDGDAFYDIDEPDDDEWNNGAGTGGPNGDGGVEGTDFERRRETHTAKSTRGATVLTMAEWEAKGSPIGDYWVWDTDGWAYWAAPLMPQEATGTLLTRIRKVTETDKCYYAINVEGQFATVDDVLNTDNGFNATANSGATGKAVALLEKITKVIRGRNGDWYIDEGSNVYRQLDPATGQTKALICAGTDFIIGTDDDVSGVIKTDPVTIDSKNYGSYFLPPDAGHPYYRGANVTGDGDTEGDNLLGTEDDDRIWYTGTSFPDATGGGKLETQGADLVTVTAAGDATQVVAGHTLQFSAKVTKGGALTSDQAVTWSLTGNKKSNTNISADGLLTVADDEPDTSTLTVRATAHVDDRQYGEAGVAVLDKNSYIVKVTSGHDAVKANNAAPVTETFKAEVFQALAPVSGGKVTWDVKDAADPTAPLDEITIDNSGVLTVAAKTRDEDVKVKVTASYAETEGGGAVASGAKEFTINASEKPIVRIEGAAEVEAGSTTNQYTAALDTSDAIDSTAWTVESPADVQIDPGSGTLTTVPDTLTAGTEIKIKAAVTYHTDKTVETTKTVKIAAPKTVELTAKTEKMKKGENFTFKAEVKNAAGGKYASQQMQWTLTGIQGSSTYRDNGDGTFTLTVANDETAKELTLTVESRVSAGATVTQKVTVGGEGIDASSDTITIGGSEYYVLYREPEETENRKALILSKDVVSASTMFSNTTKWEGSWVQDSLNHWLNQEEQKDLKAAVWKDFDGQYAPIYTRSPWNSTNYTTSYDPVFLLSRADVYGTATYEPAASMAEEYTTGVVGKLNIPGDSWVANYNNTAVVWWLRSASSTYVDTVNKSGDSGFSQSSKHCGMRPALWVKIQ